MKPIILFFQSTWSKSWRDKLSGVYKFADSAGWHIQVIETGTSASDIRHLLARWKPIGCLVDRALQNGRAPTRIFGKTPVVFLDQNPETAGACIALTHDSAASTRMAISELRRRGLERLAFVSWKESHFWEQQRRIALQTYASSYGLEHYCTTLNAQTEQWLLKLPKPCGIICASDITAQRILSMAMLCKIAVPDEIAVIGIDNDEGICEHTIPTLTSVAPDFVAAGYHLGELLQKCIRRRLPKAVLETYGPREIVVRESSLWLPSVDPRVRKALLLIRASLGNPDLSVKDIIATMNCSRTFADTLFQRAVGHSIINEIHHQRIVLACKLLRNPRQRISPIPALCGYMSEPFFKCLFKKETGLTMREWRKRNAISRF